MKIGFLGAGNMASAIHGGLLRDNLFPPDSILVYDVLIEKAKEFAAKGAVQKISEEELAAESDVILLAVKPQNFPELLPKIKSQSKGKLVISIAAGILIETIHNVLTDASIVRVMPNLPMIYGMGVTVLCKGTDVTDEQFTLAKKIFDACGKTGIIDESQMNSIIAVHASSPAFIFLFAKSIGDYADSAGIDRAEAIRLFAHTMAGSAKMLIENSQLKIHNSQSGTGVINPSICDDLIDMVASPGGTTRAALDRFDELKFSEIIQEACGACTKRAIELGQ